jgi:putative transposase
VVKYTWGGARPGAGRRPKREVAGVPHLTRQEHSAKHPVLITLRVELKLGNLRNKKVHDVVRECLLASRGNSLFRVCHYSVQKHRIYLIAEADDRVALSRGVQGMSVRIAKSLNRLWGGRKGPVFEDRYEVRVLDQGRTVRHALALVFLGFRGTRRGRANRLDPYSSAEYFDGWRDVSPTPPGGLAPVVSPQTNLLSKGWRRAGFIGLDEMPPETLD